MRRVERQLQAAQEATDAARAQAAAESAKAAAEAANAEFHNAQAVSARATAQAAAARATEALDRLEAAAGRALCGVCGVSVQGSAAFIDCGNERCNVAYCVGCFSIQVKSIIPNPPMDGVRCPRPTCTGRMTDHTNFFMCFESDSDCKTYYRNSNKNNAMQEMRNGGMKHLPVTTPCCNVEMRSPFVEGCVLVGCRESEGGCGRAWHACTIHHPAMPVEIYERFQGESAAEFDYRAHEAAKELSRQNGWGPSYFVWRDQKPWLERMWMRYYLEQRLGRQECVNGIQDFDSAPLQVLSQYLVLLSLPPGGYGISDAYYVDRGHGD